MRCASCGADRLPDDARFCPYCGVAVAAGGAAPPTSADPETIVIRAAPADATPIATPAVLESASRPTDLTPPIGPAPDASPAGEPSGPTGQAAAATGPTAPTPVPTPTPVPADASPPPVRLDVGAARVYDVPTPPPSADATVATHLRPLLRRLVGGTALLGAAAGAAAAALLMVLVAALLWQGLPETNRSLLGIPSNLSELRGSLAVWTTLHGIGGAVEGAGDTPLLGPLLALAATAAGGVAALEVIGRDRPTRERRAVGLLVGLPYAVIGLILVTVSRQESWAPNALAAVPACGAIGALGGLIGVEAWHRRGRTDTDRQTRRADGPAAVAGRALRLLAIALAAALVAGLLGNAVAIGSGEETDTSVGAWYAGLYAVEHAVALLALGLGAVAERAGVLGVPLLLDDVDAVPRVFRVTDLDAALPGAAHVGLTLLLVAAAYGLFAVAGYRAARAAGPRASLSELLIRWIVVTLTLAAALLVLVVLAYPVTGDETTFGPRPGSVLGWALLGGGAAAFVGTVLGAPQAVVREAVLTTRSGIARIRGRAGAA